MKNLIRAAVLLSMLSPISCSKVIYTNEQVMNDCKTKESIVKKFGVPDEKRAGEGTEEWLYKYEFRKPDLEKSFADRVNTKTVSVVNFTMYERYIIFRMDAHGNVFSWQCEGINFTKRKLELGKTVAWSAVGVGLFLLFNWFAHNTLPYGGGL
ncbi:MAG TPA: hypothetical protein VIM16_15340 [Mucilaginibacter sp.]|jgi:hypothetical protein